MFTAAPGSDDDADQGWDPGVSFILVEDPVAEEGDEQAQDGDDDDADVDADIFAVDGGEGLAAQDAVDDGEAGDGGQVQENHYVDEIEPV